MRHENNAEKGNMKKKIRRKQGKEGNERQAVFKAYCSNHYIAVGDNNYDDVDCDKEESTGEEEGHVNDDRNKGRTKEEKLLTMISYFTAKMR